MQVASCLALTASAIALNTALNTDEPATEREEDDAGGGSWTCLRETYAVSGELIAMTVVTMLVETAFILVTKWGPFESADGMHLCLQLLVSLCASSYLIKGLYRNIITTSVVLEYSTILQHPLLQSPVGFHIELCAVGGLRCWHYCS